MLVIKKYNKKEKKREKNSNFFCHFLQLMRRVEDMQKFQLRLLMIYMYRLCQSMKIKDDFKSKIFLPLELDEIFITR